MSDEKSADYTAECQSPAKNPWREIVQPFFDLMRAAEIAPGGKTGVYKGAAQSPWFLTKVLVPLFYGHLLMLIFILAACAPAQNSLPEPMDARRARIEGGLMIPTPDNIPLWNSTAAGPPSTVWERMIHHRVAGLQLTVIDDYSVVISQGYGLVDSETSRPMLNSTLLQVGAVGQLLTAAVVLQEVKKGTLDLDGDVHQYLSSWQLPDMGTGENHLVTPRLLLSHQSGLGFLSNEGFLAGEDKPTLRQMLAGDPPARGIPVHLAGSPGVLWEMSPAGYLVLQQLLEDVTGQEFDLLLARRIIEPLKLENTAYNPLPSPEFSDSAALPHNYIGKPVPGGWYEYPNQGYGGGLWSTSTDMSIFVIELMKSLAGSSSLILNRDSATSMFTRQAYIGGKEEKYEMGLGVYLSEIEGHRLIWQEATVEPGYSALVVCLPKIGKGMVVLGNSIQGGQLARELLVAVAHEFQWPGSGHSQ